MNKKFRINKVLKIVMLYLHKKWKNKKKKALKEKRTDLQQLEQNFQMEKKNLLIVSKLWDYQEMRLILIISILLFIFLKPRMTFLNLRVL